MADLLNDLNKTMSAEEKKRVDQKAAELRAKKIFDPFAGENEEFEIETIAEFRKKTCGLAPKDIHLDGWVFQEVDFSSVPLDDFSQYDVRGASFWGCTVLLRWECVVGVCVCGWVCIVG
jgi:hypothetical protein